MIRKLLTERQKLIRARKGKRAWSERHKAAGLCSGCTNKVLPGFSRCGKCRTENWIPFLPCLHCGRNLATPRQKGSRYHDLCRIRWRRIRARLIWNTSQRSPAYIKGHRKAALNYQRLHKRLGLCANCPRRAVGRYCRTHERSYA